MPVARLCPGGGKDAEGQSAAAVPASPSQAAPHPKAGLGESPRSDLELWIAPWHFLAPPTVEVCIRNCLPEGMEWKPF